jgi:hypothetical protein
MNQVHVYGTDKRAKIVERSAGFTAPWRVRLLKDGVAVNLTGCTVKFFLTDSQYWLGQQFNPPLSGEFHDVSNLKVDNGTCAADADTSNFPVASGWICASTVSTWFDTPGNFHFQFKVTDGSGYIDYYPDLITDYMLILGPTLDAL